MISFDEFKEACSGKKREMLIQLAFNWMTQAKKIASAQEVIINSHESLSALNDYLLTLLEELGALDRINSDQMQFYKQRRLEEFRDGKARILSALNVQGALYLEKSRSEIGSNAGKISGKKRQNTKEERNLKIKAEAKRLLTAGKAKHEIASVLAQKFSLTSKRIREILRED